MKPGVYSITNAEYHASGGISRSAISELKKSPLHYWDKYLNPNKALVKDSKAFALGAAVHALILQPEIIDAEFAIFEKINLRTKEGRELKKNFDAKAVGKQVIDQADFEIASMIAKEVLNHPKVAIILQGAQIEKSFYWIDDDSGLLCKSRPDIFNDELSIIAELKTTNSPTPEAFTLAIRRYQYHIQAAMQIDAIKAVTGKEIRHFVFIASPTERPFKPYIYTLQDETIELGRREYKEALKLAKICYETNRWDVEREKIINLNFSEYALNFNPFTQLMEIYQDG